MSKSSETGVSHIEHDPRRDERISNSRVFMIAAMVAFGGFLFGYDCIIGGPLTDTNKFQEDFGTPQDPDGKLGFTAALKGAIVCILSVGTFFGALFAPFLCDKWGRRKGIMVTCFIFGIGILVQTIAGHIGVLMLGRAIAGFGVGLVSVMVPLYQSECVPGSRRGTMVSCYQLAITIGLFVGTIVVNFTKDMTSKGSYQIPIALQFVWSFILLVAMFFFPETPRFLIKQGDWDGAIQAKVRLSGLPEDHPLLLDELHEIQGNLDHELSLGPGTYAQCWQGTNFRRTLLGIFMQAFQQCKPPAPMTGVNFIFYFGAMFFKGAGLKDEFVVNIIMGSVNVLMTIPGLYLVEKLGRRRLLLVGAVIQSTSHLLVGTIFQATHGTKPVWTAVFSATFIAAFAASWGPCAWVITSELFGLRTRAKQMSFATAGNWGFNALLGQIAPMISGTPEKPVLGTNVAFLWGALNVGCWAYVYFFIPELRGLQLEQVDELFESNVSARNSFKFVPKKKYGERSRHELKKLSSTDFKDPATVTEREIA